MAEKYGAYERQELIQFLIQHLDFTEHSFSSQRLSQGIICRGRRATGIIAKLNGWMPVEYEQSPFISSLIPLRKGACRVGSLRLSYLSRWSHPVSGPADSKTPPPQSLSAPQVGNRRKKHSEAHSPKTPTSGRDDELILYNGKAVLMPVRLRMGGNRPER